MKLRDRAMRWAVPLFIEGPAQRASFEQLQQRLAHSGQQIAQQIAQKPDSPANQALLRHIIGIERWGQRRLQVALGQPLLADGHTAYLPEAGLSWVQLGQAFQETRGQTLGLLPALQKQSTPDPIPHNALGPLSLKAWLHYLNLHAALESKRLR